MKALLANSLGSMKTIRNLINITTKVTLFSVLTLVFLVACSTSPNVSRSLEALNPSIADPTADTIKPRAVLTIAPTQAPPTATVQNTSAPTRTQVIVTPTEVSTATQSPPTEIVQATATATQSVSVSTPTDAPTELASSTFTPEPNQSACPLGCVEPPAGCDIKGNINNEGVKIYHVPGQDFYDKTIISPEKGERWFCTPEEAVANGWRASKR